MSTTADNSTTQALREAEAQARTLISSVLSARGTRMSAGIGRSLFDGKASWGLGKQENEAKRGLAEVLERIVRLEHPGVEEAQLPGLVQQTKDRLSNEVRDGQARAFGGFNSGPTEFGR